METRQYRAEIDGLRAVSVMGVVLFHFELGFPGGFVGVDVFFVISGFLITGILLRELREERFSLSDFWARRIRRIAPAALAMVLLTLLIGAYLQTPDRFAALARSAMAHALMAANCFFTRDAGYFAESSDLEPLLHTWSLAVEEQFYLIFPLLVILIWRTRRGTLVWVFTLLALGSFGWSCVTLESHPKEAFFLLPTRAWELLAGGILAITSQASAASQASQASWFQLNKTKREALSSLGLLLVLLPMFFYERATPFPGPAALPPVIGAIMVILGGGKTLTGRMLSGRMIVGIGLMSYSLYLWHWPLVVFAREVNFELSPAWKGSLLVASFVLAYLSWRGIEEPFRKGAFLSTKRRALSFGLVSAIGIFVTSLGIKMNAGLPGRFPQELQVIIEDVQWNGAEYTSAESRAAPIGSPSKGPIDFILWGDSHGASAAPAVEASARFFGLRGLAYLNNGIPPVTGLWFADLHAEEAEHITAMNERVFNEIIDHAPEFVILVGRWVARCEGYNVVEMHGEQNDYHFETMVVDAMNPKPNFQDSSAALSRQLRAMNARFAEKGIRLILLQQVPESTITGTAALFYAQKRFPKTHALPQFTTSLQEHADRQKRTMDALAQLSQHGLEVIDPTEQFFQEGKGLKVYAERSYYRDEDHLSRAGSLHYLTPVFKKILRQHSRLKSR